ncbi:MAG TPA: SPFH domain-containing protein [Kofleriaceae bacterium]|nr:SPFH domain-containing protein [Kofleriaceae bacterium]
MATTTERYQEGWRAGKPVEDPEKLKRWGYVGAKPSEYLVCTRRGQIDRSRSGQGMRIFKWPWLSVSIVPTTLQRIEFTADQVTRERVGVTVTGIAVYRIAEPLLAFRVLNFTFGEAASEKLAATLREMFVGSARRLIANLSLEDCLTRRKEAIAGYLMDEIAPVVGGEGSPDDTTTKGWGVVIDTIEIQQVQVQSKEVFAHLQAPFRAEIAARAQLAELERERQVAEQRGESERKTAEQEAELARRRSELERERALHQIAIAEEHRRAQAAAEVAALEAERARVEAMHVQTTLQAEHERQLEAMRMEMERRRAEEKDFAAQLTATHQRRLAEIENLVAQGRLATNLVTHGLPKIAEALAQTIGTVNYTQIGNGSGTGPLEAVPAAIAQLLALAKSFGVELPKRAPIDAEAAPATDR